MKNAVFWGVAPCRCRLNRRSAATCSRWFFARGFFYPEDGGDTILRNLGSIDYIDTAPHARRRHSSTLPWLEYWLSSQHLVHGTFHCFCCPQTVCAPAFLCSDHLKQNKVPVTSHRVRRRVTTFVPFHSEFSKADVSLKRFSRTCKVSLVVHAHQIAYAVK
jgi:hypothetical protein